MNLLGWNVTEFGPLWPDLVQGKWLGHREWSHPPQKEELLHARRRVGGRLLALFISINLFLQVSSWPDGGKWPRHGEPGESLKRSVQLLAVCVLVCHLLASLSLAREKDPTRSRGTCFVIVILTFAIALLRAGQLLEARVPSAYCVDALVGKHGFSEVSRSLHKLDLHSRRHP